MGWLENKLCETVAHNLSKTFKQRKTEQTRILARACDTSRDKSMEQGLRPTGTGRMHAASLRFLDAFG